MDKLNIDNFEQLLQKQSIKNHTALYNKVLSRNEHTYKPQDVIETVYYQMKEIHLADCSTSARSSTKNLNTVKKSHFLAVNKLPVYSEVIRPNPNKFDTQCVSDTQLINLIETAEAVDTHTGMTQEFDTTFAHSEERSTNNLKHVEKGNMSLNVRTSKDTVFLNEINSQNTQENVITENQDGAEKNTVYNSNKEEQTFKNIVDKTNKKFMKEVPYLDSLFVNAASEDTITLIENVPSTPVTDVYQSYNNEDVDMDTRQWTQRSPSPVLNTVFHFNKFKNMNVDTVECTKRSPSPVLNAIIQPNNITVDTGEQRALSPILNAINKSFESKEKTVNTEVQRASSPVWSAITQSYDSKNLNVDTGECTQRSLSPVFNMKSKKRITRTSSPLVVSLKEFENFENIVIPLIEDNDLETVKHLINSQILGRELYLNINTDDMLIDRNESPILEFNSNELQINSKDLETNDNEIHSNIVPLKEIKSVEKHSANFKDEILFSSDEEEDEENDHNQLETPDLPLTCALETSFYGNSGFLEKTMYVGFQTASNKSIQICTESFEKAQSLLDGNNIIVKEFSLTELVEKCDTITKPEKSKLSPALTSSAKENSKVHIQPNSLDGIQLRKDIVCASIKEKSCDKFQRSLICTLAKKESEIQKLDGFMTASNKKIEMSNKVLDIYQKIFKDIDLNEKFETVEDLTNTDSLFVSAYVDLESKIDKEKVIESNNKSAKTPIDKKDEEVMNEKINDELLLQEFENSEMSVKERKANTEMKEDIGFDALGVNNNTNFKITSDTVDYPINVIQNKGVEWHEQKIKVDRLKDVSSTQTTSADSKTRIGFKTASHKNNNISAQAFTKSKQLFQDIEIEMKTLEVKKKSTDTPFVSNRVFMGFKTANNKNIKISEQALSKSKNIFKDIDKDNFETEMIEDMNRPPTSQILFGGFKTASNKNINMSDEALSKSKKIFNDIHKGNAEIERNKNVNQPPFSNAVFVDFKTATNKDIKVSKENIDDDNCKTEIITDINQPSTSKAVFMGFKTANNKNIKISDSALSKSKQIFKDIDKENPEMQGIVDINQRTTRCYKETNNKDLKICEGALSKSKNTYKDIYKEMSIHTSKDNKDSGFIGFKTASNKHVDISVQAIEKCRKLFQDDMTINYCMPEHTTENQDKFTNINFRGVSTAHNKPINDPEEASVTSEKMLSDHEIDRKCKTLSCDDINKNENTIYKGFQTANKKPVMVSPDSLIRSEIILKDIEISDSTIPENIPNEFKFIGFQTANSEPVVVSKESLMASKQMLDDFSDNLTDNSGNVFVGFKTASNKNVNVCDKALAKCRRIFDDIEEIPFNEQIGAGLESKEENNTKVENPKADLEKTKQHFNDVDVSIKAVRPFSGFQTANNKTVNVTEEALAKSRQAFKNIDLQNDINMEDLYEKVIKRNKVKSPAKSFGFKTCNNKAINVSKDALIKSKQLFAVDSIIENDKTITRNDDKDPAKNSLNLDSIINTQVLNNFEETLCTEDFKDHPKENKRSGSPILSCPRAKKRKKFEIPYKATPKTVIDFNKAVETIERPVNVIEFKGDYKKTKKYTLKDLPDIENEAKITESIDPYVLNFNLDNILDFEFGDARNDLTEGKMTTEEIKRLFTEVTDKKLIPEGWLDIQLKLILWKLISYEVKFPNTLGIVCTVKNVIDQLKYRYDKELYNAERPVLRKILEKDDVCSKTMVLCVAGVYVDGVSVSSPANPTNIELLLTDGWYFVKATIDRMLSKLVYDGKIAVGRKLLISGAELVNCEQGFAPWEDTSAVRLKISGNSTAPVPWHSKLGLRLESRTSASARLSRLRVEGGKARRVRVLVTRVYPMLYVEKLQDGSTVTRSERLEHLYQAKHEAEREALIEKIYEEVEKEISDQESEESEGMSQPYGKRRCCESGSQIAKLMKISKDPAEFRAQLTPSQVRLLQEHCSKQQDKYLEAVRSRVRERVSSRNVVTLARGRVAGVEGGNAATVKGMLTIWQPNDAVLDIFKEGAWIEIMNVVPTAIRNSEIQLSAGRQSMFRPVKCKNDQLFQPYLQSLKRKCYNIKDLSENPSMTTDYNEIDTVGIIFSIDPPIRLFESIKSQFQNVYLSDIDKNMICVNFWGGIKKFGYENVLDTGQVIYCGNLQKRAGNTRKNIPQYRATEFSMFTKTPKNEIAREMVEEMNNKMYGLDRRKFCDDCTAVKQNYSVLKSFAGSENVSPYRFNNSDYNLGRNKMYIDTPIGIKTKPKSEEFSLTGLDFESTFRQQNTQELSPNTLARKKKVNEKIAKLKMYGEPPPLSHINITNKSKNATNSYKSPLVSGVSNASSNKMQSVISDNNLQNVATPKKLPKESAQTSVANECLDRSPIISMNRTYAMRSVNPVKLNFSECAIINENDNNTVDHFAEEFDGSPPLSLD